MNSNKNLNNGKENGNLLNYQQCDLEHMKDRKESNLYDGDEQHPGGSAEPSQVRSSIKNIEKLLQMPKSTQMNTNLSAHGDLS